MNRKTTVATHRPLAKAGRSSRDLIAAAAVGIVALDADARILSANAAALALLGCTASDLVGRGAHETLNAQRPAVDCELESAVRAGASQHVDDDTFFTHAGAPQPVWWTVTPLRDPEDQHLLGAVLVFGDTTAARAHAIAEAAEREQDRADLARAHQSIADLEWTAGISQALSATLDEAEAMRRLTRLVVGRLADIAIGDLISEDAVVRRAGWAVAENVDLDLDALILRPDVAAEFEPASATYQVFTSAQITEISGADLDDANVISPQSRALLRAADAEHLLVLPLIARGRVVGGFGLIRRKGAAPFADVDKLVATDIALRAALAVDNARLFRAQADVATRLQQALLPRLPELPFVATSVRYLPARDRFDVGGDWYDAFQFVRGAGNTALVVGDVAGHDIAAGATMSALRNLVRGVSVVSDGSPAAVLNTVDENLEALAIRGTATLVLATVQPTSDGRWRLRWSNAGHMPLLLLGPDGPQLLDEVHGPLLGTGLPYKRSESDAVVSPGSTLVLYTDGLVETREETIDAGLARLRRSALTLTAPLADPEAVADELLARNHVSAEDDTALLVCHLPVVRSD
jgi:PAS domain S-box-containing protein